MELPASEDRLNPVLLHDVIEQYRELQKLRERVAKEIERLARMAPPSDKRN